MLIGISIAAPIGPVAIMCMRYSLVQGVGAGLSMGLGTSMADALIGVTVGLAMGAVSEMLSQIAFWTKIVGGGFLILWGIKTLLAKVDSGNKIKLRYDKKPMITAFGFMFTIASPSTVLLFITVFSALAGPTITLNETYALSSGIFTGSFLWWILIASVMSATGKRLGKNWLNRINQLASAIIIIFGGLAIAHGLMGHYS